MARAKGIRGLAYEAGIPLSNDQLKQFRNYGLLPPRDDAESNSKVLLRLQQIFAAKEKAQTLDRRLFYLHDSNWPIETEYIRKAANEVADKIRTPDKKNRALYRCFQVRASLVQDIKPQKAIPESWRLPAKETWGEILGWPSDEDFRTIYEWCRTEIIALAYVPVMRETEDFAIVPYEEMVVLMLLHQLSIPSQPAIVAAEEAEPWP